MVEIKESNDISLLDVIGENKNIIYQVLFYSSGIILSSLLFTRFNNTSIEALKKIILINTNDIKSIIFSYLCPYLCIYALTLLLGICIIGFPFTNIIPFSIGFEIGLKLSFYYTSYNVKGIGYSLLLIIPEIALFLTVLIYTINSSSELSKQIYKITTKKSDIIEEINLKLYLKRFMIYGVITIGTSLLNALFYYLFSPIISL